MARISQRFFPQEGYTPQVRGYARVSHKSQLDKGNSLLDQETRIKAYYDLRNLEPNSVFAGTEFDQVYCEPLAQSAYDKPFRMRPMGKLIYEQISPGDHVIIDKVDRIWRD